MNNLGREETIVTSQPKRFLILVFLFTVVLAISACAHQPLPAGSKPPGFWLGLLHGFFILFSFIGSLFTDVRIYAFPNSGGWYDFGYLIGVMLFFGGGGGATARGRRKSADYEHDDEA